MQSMSKTKFDDLSSEVILCVFDYLSVADRYNAFFDFNRRIRSLVKKWTNFSRRDLLADIRRFSTLHSWYKHLRFSDGGTICYLCPMRSRQQRNTRDHRSTDSGGWHWHFAMRIREEPVLLDNKSVCEIVLRHPVQLNPFFYGSTPLLYTDKTKQVEETEERGYYGARVIMWQYEDVLKTWLMANYPAYATKLLLDEPNDDWSFERKNDWALIFKSEGEKATAAIFDAASQIWNEVKELDDVNPIEIFPRGLDWG